MASFDGAPLGAGDGGGVGECDVGGDVVRRELGVGVSAGVVYLESAVAIVVGAGDGRTSRFKMRCR